MGHDERANEAAREHDKKVDRAAQTLAKQAELRIHEMYIAPMVEEWRKKSLTFLLVEAETQETNAYNIAAAGLPHALSVGWSVRATAEICRGAYLSAQATVNGMAEGESNRPAAVENLALVEEGGRLALARVFAAVNMTMLVHKQLVEAVQARQRLAETQPVDTEAVTA